MKNETFHEYNTGGKYDAFSTYRLARDCNDQRTARACRRVISWITGEAEKPRRDIARLRRFVDGWNAHINRPATGSSR